MSGEIDNALLPVQFEKRREVTRGDLGESWDIFGDLGDSWGILGDLGGALGDDVFGENGANFGENTGDAVGELVEDDLEKPLGDSRGDAKGDLFPVPTFPALGDSGGVSSHSPLSWDNGKQVRVVDVMGLDGEEGVLTHNAPVKDKLSNIENGQANRLRSNIENGQANRLRSNIENSQDNRQRSNIENGQANRQRSKVSVQLSITYLQHWFERQRWASFGVC